MLLLSVGVLIVTPKSAVDETVNVEPVVVVTPEEVTLVTPLPVTLTTFGTVIATAAPYWKYSIRTPAVTVCSTLNAIT